MKKFLALGLAAVLMAGCATAELSPEQLSAIKRIGVVSAVGDDITIQDLPMIPIIVEDKIGSISDLGLDRYIENQLTEKLKARYEVVKLDPPIHVTKGNKTDWWYHDENYTTFDLPTSGGDKVDTYILISPATGFLFGVDHQVHGAFMAQHSTMFEKQRAVGIGYHVILVDAHTQKSIKNIVVLTDKPFEDGMFAPTVEALTPAQKEKLKLALQARIDETLTPALEQMKLLP